MSIMNETSRQTTSKERINRGVTCGFAAFLAACLIVACTVFQPVDALADEQQGANSAFSAATTSLLSDADVEKAASVTAAAKQALDNAKAAYEQALAKVAPKQKEVDIAQAAYDAADKAKSDYAKVLDQKKADLETAKAKVKSTAEQLTQKTEAKTQAESVAQAAADKVAEAKKKVEAVKEAMSSGQAAIASAQKKVDEAQAAYDAAQAKIAEGSFGFFEAMGSTDALNALNRMGSNNLGATLSTTDSDGKLFTSFTHKGEATDATSLENMKNTIQWMKRCNELRATDEVFPACNSKMLKVSDTLMAMAQSNTNWSDSHIGHAGQNGGNFNVGENIAWNYGSDPYLQWYDKEKEVYLQKDLNNDGKIGDGNSTVTGHYTNIMNSAYGSTGFAICTRGSMNGWKTYGQVFSRDSYNGETTYTVDEYETRFMEYYDSLVTKPTKALADAKAELKAAQDAAGEGALAAAEAELAEAEAAKVSADEAVTKAAAAVADAQKEADAAAAAIAPAEADVEAAQANVDAAIKEVEAKKAALDEAILQCDQEQANVEPFKVDLDAAQAAYDEALAAEQKVREAAERAVGLYNIANAQIAAISAKNYTGSAIEPTVEATLNGKTLVQGADYELAYSSNVAAGTAEVAVIGIGKYEGEQVVPFTIGKAAIKNASFAKIKAQTLKKKGVAVKPKVKVTFNGTKLKAKADYTVTYKNNKKKGTAKAIVKGKGNFKGKKVVKFKIK